MSVHELLELSNSLASGKSPCFDEFDPSVYIQNSVNITSPCNDCFIHGNVPDQIKIARVTPIFKGDDSRLFSNYGPISVLPLSNFSRELCIIVLFNS